MKNYITTLIAGALLPLAFAPFSMPGMSLISLAILYYILEQAHSKNAWLIGLLFGIGFFGVGVSWVFVSIHTYGNTNSIIAAFITLLFILFMSCYTMLFAMCMKWCFARAPLFIKILGFAGLWSLCEWLRAILFTGFPWLLIGYSQINTPLHYLAPIIGVYGLSFIVAVAAALLANAVWYHSARKLFSYRLLIALLLIYILPILLKPISWTHALAGTHQVSIIQGAVPLADKWSDNSVDTILDQYKTMTDVHWNSELIVWPEAAIPIPYQEASVYLQIMAASAREHHATIITGIPFMHQTQYYNGIIALGNGQGTYLKHHLVPFGEFLPFEHWLRGLINFFNIPMSDLLPGPLQQPLLLANHIKIAPFICYEIAYSDMLLRDLPQAELLITVSDDAWFGKSFAAAQHLQIAQMRSLQTGRYQIVANNSGISAIISATGDIVQTVPQFKPEVLTGSFQAMHGSTPWVTIGDNLILLVLLLLVLSLIITTIILHSKAHLQTLVEFANKLKRRYPLFPFSTNK